LKWIQFEQEEDPIMVAVVTSNNIYSRDNRAPAPAVHEDDGTNFPWRMFFDENQRIVDADTLAECLDYLIVGYSVLNDEEKAAAREELAGRVQQLARATIVSSITPEQAEKLADWEWNLLNFGDNNLQNPYGWGDGTGVIGEADEEKIDEWNSIHPLVLVDTKYKPFTEIFPPLSGEGDYEEVKNIIWLRPNDELGFLRSLSRIGYITFGAPSAVVALEVARKN
jgi:hypothetical protein